MTDNKFNKCIYTQCTDTVVMVAPTAFARNEDAATDNVFMHDTYVSSDTEGVIMDHKHHLELIKKNARSEFNCLVKALQEAGVQVVVAEGNDHPDEVFPNNWISTHSNIDLSQNCEKTSASDSETPLRDRTSTSATDSETPLRDRTSTSATDSETPLMDRTSMPTIMLYPMADKSRRKERRMDIIYYLYQVMGKNQKHVQVQVYDVATAIKTDDASIHSIAPIDAHRTTIIESPFEEMSGQTSIPIQSMFDASTTMQSISDTSAFLEGTGAMVLDRHNRIAYCALSARADRRLLNLWAVKMGYTPVSFHAQDAHGKAIYHTNVMMSVGARCAVVCLESIRDTKERQTLRHFLEEKSGKTIIELTLDQVYQFAGNMLQLRRHTNDQTHSNQSVWVMSESAYNCLDATQKSILALEGEEIIHVPLPTIERIGGGSCRCMLLELFY